MAKKSLGGRLAFIVVVLVIFGPLVSAGDPLPASSGTSALFLTISAEARGNLLSDSDLVLTQGTADLSDNPPLDPQGEGQATTGYDEKTVATSGTITYTKTIDLDSSNQGAIGANLETVRQIDYTNQGDGNDVGAMYSKESVMIEVDNSGSEQGDPAANGQASGGMWIPDCSNPPCDNAVCDDDQEASSALRVIAGSEVHLKEGSVNSASSSRTISDDPDAGIELSYSVDVDGSGQTGKDRAEGKAEVFIDAILEEGSDAGLNETTEMSHDQSVIVNGLIEISMETGYSSP